MKQQYLYQTKQTIAREKDHYIVLKGPTQLEDVTIVNIYASNLGASKFIMQTLTDVKREIHSNTIRVENFNTPLRPMDRSARQKISKKTVTLQICTKYLIQKMIHGLFKRAWKILQDRRVRPQNKFQQIQEVEIISSIFPDHNSTMKPEFQEKYWGRGNK